MADRRAVLALLGLTACDVPDRLRELFADPERVAPTPAPPSPEINAPAYGIPETEAEPQPSDTDPPIAPVP